MEYVGIVSAIASMASVPALVMWGNLSDKIKRRRVFILIGFFGAFLSLFLIIFVHTMTSYISVLILFQILAMASVPVATLLILENSEQKSWGHVMGKFNSFSALGTVFGLAVGVLILVFFGSNSYTILPYMYLISAWFYLAAGIVSMLVLKEPKSVINREKIGYIYALHIIERVRYFPTHIVHIPGNDKKIAIPPKLKIYLLTTLILMFGFQLFFTPYPVFIIRTMNASDNDIYIMYLLNSLFSAATYIPAGKYINFIGANRMLKIFTSIRVFLFIAMGIFSFFIINSFSYLIIFIIMYGIFGGLWSFIGLSEVTSISNMATQTTRGKVIGYYNSLNGVGQIIGAALSGFLAYDISYSVDFILSGLVVLTGVIILTSSHPPDINLPVKSSTSQS